MRRALLLSVMLMACAEGDGTGAPQLVQAEPLSPADAELMGRALAAMHSRNHDKVAQILRPLLGRDPALADALFVAGSAAYELQRYGDAVRLLSAAVLAKPDFLPTSSALAFAHHKLGAFDKARDAFTAIAAVAPKNHKAHYGLGLVALDQGQLDRARTHLERALALKPEYLKARFHLARLLQEEGRLEPARDALAKIVDAWPSHEEALYRYARVLSALGEHASAQRVMDRRSEVYAGKDRMGSLIAQQRAGKDSPALREELVTLWLRLGEWMEAHEACRAAIAAFPDEPSLQELLSRVLDLR